MIYAILIDAMFTIFTPRSGSDRYTIKKELIKRHLNRNADYATLKRICVEKRAYWEERLPARHGDKWTIIDREIILALFPDVSFNDANRAGKMIAHEFLLNPNFYEVTEDAQRFLTEARCRSVAVIVASNQDKEKLRELTIQFKITHFLKAIYASTEVGFEKPDPHFFEAILQTETLLSQECVMIGNNPQNDMRGCQGAGITGVLYDAHNQYPDFSGYRVPHLNDVWDLPLEWQNPS
jgi:FMN phosphatase YigB (HAD superfamily)